MFAVTGVPDEVAAPVVREKLMISNEQCVLYNPTLNAAAASLEAVAAATAASFNAQSEFGFEEVAAAAGDVVAAWVTSPARPHKTRSAMTTPTHLAFWKADRHEPLRITLASCRWHLRLGDLTDYPSELCADPRRVSFEALGSCIGQMPYANAAAATTSDME
jgi:hypothetical protein